LYLERLTKFGSALCRVLQREAGFPVLVTKKEILTATAELVHDSLKQRDSKRLFRNYGLTLPYDALPLMLTRMLTPFFLTPSPCQVVLKFPTFMPQTMSVWQDILTPWKESLHLTNDRSLIHQIAESKDACVLLMGSERVASLAHAFKEKCARVIYMGPTGVQSIVLRDTSAYTPAIAHFISHRSLLNSGQYCQGSKRCLVPITTADFFLEELKQAVLNYPIGEPNDCHTLASNRMVLDKSALFQQQSYSLDSHPELISLDWLPRYLGRFYLASPNFRLQSNLDPFGPILIVQTYQNDNQLVDLLNDAPYASTITWFGCPKKMDDSTFVQHTRDYCVSLFNPNVYDFSSPEWLIGGRRSLHFVSTNGKSIPHSSFNLKDVMCT
jgi:hypothetical protein